MTRSEAFNEWMRRYIKEPERFTREFQNVTEFISAQDAGVVPSYGDRCDAYLASIEAEE